MGIACDHRPVGFGSCQAPRLASGMARYEDATRSPWTDRAINHLAGIRRLKLDTFVATLVAVRMILVIHCNLGNLGLRQCRIQCRAEDADGSHSPAQQRAPRKSHRSVLRSAEHGSLSRLWT